MRVPPFDMFDEVVSVINSVWTVRTGVGPLPSVNPQMPLEIRLLIGAVGAPWAGIGTVEQGGKVGHTHPTSYTSRRRQLREVLQRREKGR